MYPWENLERPGSAGLGNSFPTDTVGTDWGLEKHQMVGSKKRLTSCSDSDKTVKRRWFDKKYEGKNPEEVLGKFNPYQIYLVGNWR